jgi:large subunit ribosomal protein L18
MTIQKQIAKQRQRRRFRVRNRLRSSRTSRPRLSVFRSNRHMYAQIIDDVAGETLVAASTMEKAVSGPGSYAGNKAAAESVGKLIAERAIEKGIKQVVFDRGPYQYHGRVASLADAARRGGLEF